MIFICGFFGILFFFYFCAISQRFIKALTMNSTPDAAKTAVISVSGSSPAPPKAGVRPRKIYRETGISRWAAFWEISYARQIVRIDRRNDKRAEADHNAIARHLNNAVCREQREKFLVWVIKHGLFILTSKRIFFLSLPTTNNFLFEGEIVKMPFWAFLSRHIF